MQVFAVVVESDDTIRVVAADVKKVTPQFYMIERPESTDWRDRSRYAFGYSNRLSKFAAHLTPRAAVDNYMKRRQKDKENARAVIAQATKQIASANELLMHLPVEEPPAVDAVDRGSADQHEPSTRV